VKKELIEIICTNRSGEIVFRTFVKDTYTKALDLGMGKGVDKGKVILIRNRKELKSYSLKKYAKLSEDEKTLDTKTKNRYIPRDVMTLQETINCPYCGEDMVIFIDPGERGFTGHPDVQTPDVGVSFDWEECPCGYNHTFEEIERELNKL
jgi:hypothetical protein